MLCISMRVGVREEEIIIRDADGVKLCEILLNKVDRNKVSLAFDGPKTVQINRRSIDETKDWKSKPKSCEICAICKRPMNAAEADSTGVAHRECAAREMQRYPE